MAKAKRQRVYERPLDQPIAITPVEYSGLQEAYDEFNKRLFGGKLVDVFITYQRHAHSRGHFSADRFAGRTAMGRKHELALNPDHFIGRSDADIAATLVHEMVHCWQQQYGKPGSRGYHNKEWAAKMKEVGLWPSNTGGIGGKETGQQMSHWIMPDGQFSLTFAVLAATGWKLNLESAQRGAPDGGRKSKTKFTCTGCGQNAWGKPDLAVTCTPCRIEMVQS
jgi:SprT-like family protein